MASSHLAVFISSLLLLPLAFPSIAAAYGDTLQGKKTEVVVEGVVYCQSCDNYGSWSLSKAEPIASAKVSVICRNDMDQVSFYKAFETDGNGYFFAELEGFQMSHSLLDHPLQSCRVKLVSSPLENCNLLSNVNYGLNGSPLRYENKRLHRKDYEVVVYAAGPLAFRPANCPAPTNY
ncbi:Pollen Ole e 1 allergen and extensin family protein [Theobroma cacao]|uniref:Pollen Ole e 1 allergen and extensin family protein n=1 Tax=Theobroma cacao TaxID=3641 RepID=A0A061FKX6_THECC|nr:Pollen Ole e 1 allergen and extensin family protein [Theobroma cacao]